MPDLLMLSPAPVIEAPGNEVVLDVRFVEGMKLHAQLWPGPVRCVLWRRDIAITQPIRYARKRLEFDLIVLEPNESPPPLLLEGAALVLCAADDMRHLDLPQRLSGQITRLVYTIEQGLRGRIAAAVAHRGSIRRRLGSMIWTLLKERPLRRALAAADAVQCNGPMAYNAYRKVGRDTIVFLDNRVRLPLVARAADLEARAQRLREGRPLRLCWFGEMSHDGGLYELLQMAFLLRNRGLDFTLDLYGEGEEKPGLQGSIAALGLGDRVHLHPAMNLDAQLIPRLKKECDLFVSAHALPNPLSSYIEAMGCGLPILCYRNRAWRSLRAQSNAGWEVRKRSVAGLVRQVEWLNTHREALIDAATRAAEFARAHSFEMEFARRMTHLRQVAGVDD